MLRVRTQRRSEKTEREIHTYEERKGVFGQQELVVARKRAAKPAEML